MTAPREVVPAPRTRWSPITRRFRLLLRQLSRKRKALEGIGKVITIVSGLIAAFQYLSETEDRRLDRLYKAWDVVAKANKDTVNGARDGALADLATHGFSLAGISLVGGHLNGVRLHAANLAHANMQNAELQEADLDHAHFDGADLTNADLAFASLQSARFAAANLSGADMRGARLSAANFEQANLNGAVFVDGSLDRIIATQADLRDAQLNNADVRNADFSRTDLRGASLADIRNWHQIRNLRRANVARVIDPPPGFVRWAVDSMGAVEQPADSAWEAVKYDFGTDSSKSVRLGLSNDLRHKLLSSVALILR